jgi:hypothetical protein
MHEPAEQERGLRDLFPNLSEAEWQYLTAYCDIALEIAGANDGAVGPVDISPPISTLKERSNRNLKDQS